MSLRSKHPPRPTHLLATRSHILLALACLGLAGLTSSSQGVMAAAPPFALDLLLPGHAVPDGSLGTTWELEALHTWWRRPGFLLSSHRAEGRTRWHARADLAPGRFLARVSAPYPPWTWNPPAVSDLVGTSLEGVARGGLYFPAGKRANAGLEFSPSLVAVPLTQGAWSRTVRVPFIVPITSSRSLGTRSISLLAPTAELLSLKDPGQERTRTEVGLVGGRFTRDTSTLTGFRVRLVWSMFENIRYLDEGADAPPAYTFQTGPSALLGAAGASFVRMWVPGSGSSRIRLDVAAVGSRSGDVSALDASCEPCNTLAAEALVTRQDLQGTARLGAVSDVSGRVQLGGEARVSAGTTAVQEQGFVTWNAGAGMVSWLGLHAGRLEVLATFALSRVATTTFGEDPQRSFEVDVAGGLHVQVRLDGR